MPSNIYPTEKQYNYTYTTTNLLNGIIYVGKHSTDTLYDGYIGSGGKEFKKALKEFGKENFRHIIMAFYTTSDEAYAAEALIVTKEFIKEDTNYNMVPGGNNGRPDRTGIPHSAESIKQMSEALLDKPLSAEHKKNISDALLDKPLSAEHKRTCLTLHWPDMHQANPTLC